MKSVLSIVAIVLLGALFCLPSTEAGSRTRIVIHQAAYAAACETSTVCGQPVLVATCSQPERVVTRTKAFAMTCDCNVVKVKTRTVETPTKTAVIRRTK